MAKTNKLLLITTFVLLIAVVILIVNFFVFERVEKVYSAVYLESGDLYFGKLYNFPRLYLTNVYFLQRNYDPLTANISPYMLTKLTSSIWGAKDELILNREKIVWIGQLEVGSTLATAMENPHLYAVSTTATTKNGE